MKKLLALSIVASVFVGGIAYGQTSLFDDVPEGHYAEESIAWAVENGITSGVTPTEFGPDETLTRAQMVTFLKRYHDNVAVPSDDKDRIDAQEYNIEESCGDYYEAVRQDINIAVVSYFSGADLPSLHRIAFNSVVSLLESGCNPNVDPNAVYDRCNLAAELWYPNESYKCEDAR